jgi:hypothetical protein
VWTRPIPDAAARKVGQTLPAFPCRAPSCSPTQYPRFGGEEVPFAPAGTGSDQAWIGHATKAPVTLVTNVGRPLGQITVIGHAVVVPASSSGTFTSGVLGKPPRRPSNRTADDESHIVLSNTD